MSHVASVSCQRNLIESVELEAILALSNKDVSSSVLPRWERKLKQLQSQQQQPCSSTTVSSSPVKSSSSSSSSSAPRTPTASVTHLAKTPCSVLRNQTNNNNTTITTTATQQQQQKRASKTPQCADRLIPARSALDFNNATYNMRATTCVPAAPSTAPTSSDDNGVPSSSSSSSLMAPPPTPRTESQDEFQKALSQTMGAGNESRILAFRKKAPVPKCISEGEYENAMGVLYQRKMRSFSSSSSSSGLSVGSSVGGGALALGRVIPNAPEKILDAPDLLNDFYINPLDWSSSNQLGVALGPTVYLWTASTGSISELCTLESPAGGASAEYVSSLRFVQEGGGYVAIGSSDNVVSLWDVEAQKCLRRLPGHSARVSSLAWNGHILTSGGRDSQILHHDVRVPNHLVARLAEGHTQEVCSLQWSPDGASLASGSNDNAVCIWDARGGVGEISAGSLNGAGPRLRLTEHLAAVKALAWSPYARNVLATGGGTSDRTIKIWNTATGHCEQSVDTGSQVCSLLFNPHSRELLSSHGFTENQLTLWNFPRMTKIKDLTGHTSRVLHTAISPDGTTVVSAGADETLRFWKVFQPVAAASASLQGSCSTKAASSTATSSRGVMKMSIR